MKRIGLVIAAVLIHIALASAAVETALSSSPVRWWVAGIVALYFGAVLIAWRVWSPPAASATPENAAIAGSGVFLALFAITAWAPNGLTSGVRLFGAMTSTLMLLLTAATVIAVAVDLARLRALPLWVRYAIAAVAGYGFLSFAFAVRSGTQFESLLNGHALWVTLPRWLQGATLAVGMLLPLGLARAVFEGLGRREGARSLPRLAHRTVAVLTAMSMVSSAILQGSAGTVGPFAAVAIASRSEPPPADPITSMDDWRRQTFGDRKPLEVWKQFSEIAEADLKQPGADPSDVSARANLVGEKVQNVFDFMRDQIAVEPYEGVLRGARGTLAAAAGNPLDRSLLAQGLLKAHGIESRLVSGQLSDEQSSRLLSIFVSRSMPGALQDLMAVRSVADIAAESTALSRRFQVSEPKVRDLVTHAKATSWAFWEGADKDWAAQHGFLSNQLRKASVATSLDGAEVLALLKERLSRHYWLQVRDSSGNWSEFDPSFPDGKPGTAYGMAPTVLADVPEDRYHRFEFTLVYRTTSGTSPGQQVLLASTLTTAEALFSPLVFQIQPVDLGMEAADLQAMDPVRKIAALKSAKRFRGILSDGKSVTGTRIFDLEGSTYDDAKTLKGSAEALLGGFLGGEEETKPQFVDLQVVMRMTGPGREPVTQTRTLVRASDLSARNFAPPVLEWRILVQPEWISERLAGFQLLQAATASGALAAAVLSGKDVEAQPPPLIPSELLQLVQLRQTASARIIAAHAGVRALVDEPLVTIASQRLSSLDEQGQTVTSERAIDIVENGIRYLPASAEVADSLPFDAALQQGAADSTLEDAFLRVTYPDSLSHSGVVLLNQAVREQRPITVTNATAPDDLRRIGVSATDIDWIRDNEPATRRLVIAAVADGTAVWWSVRPDGNAILRVSGGRGQGEVEHEENTFLVAMKIAAFLVCLAETGKHLHEEPHGAMTQWKLIWCTMATVSSVGLFAAAAHGGSTVFLIIEAGEFLLTGALETKPWQPPGRRGP